MVKPEDELLELIASWLKPYSQCRPKYGENPCPVRQLVHAFKPVQAPEKMADIMNHS
jgi:hypothetical protein